MRCTVYFRIFACALPFVLCGCGLDDWANRNMPVVGQRCEHWQCFTEGGQQQSDINHEERMRQEAGDANGAVAPSSPPSAATGAPAALNPPSGQPAAPAALPVATYQYVPRPPSAPGTTPYDNPPLGPQ